MYRLLVLILGAIVSTTYADTIYKSVDDEGNVIYSEEPPNNGKNVESLPAPRQASDDEVEAARERQRKLNTYLDESAESNGGDVSTDGSARREAAKRRAIWGKDWPIHEPLNR